MKSVITIASIKGGVGKSTTAIHLRDVLRENSKVLGVDLDPQASFTDYVLRDVPVEMFDRYSARQMLLEEFGPSDCIHNDIIPATIELAEVTEQMGFTNYKALADLRERFRALDGYDYAVIDSVGGINYEFLASLFLANIVLVPVQIGRWSLKALAMIHARIEAMPAEIRPELVAVPCRVSEKKGEILREKIPANFCRVSDSTILSQEPVVTAVEKGEPLKGKHTEMYRQLAEEVVLHGEKVRA